MHECRFGSVALIRRHRSINEIASVRSTAPVRGPHRRTEGKDATHLPEGP